MPLLLITPKQWKERFSDSNPEVTASLGLIYATKDIYSCFDALSNLINTCKNVDLATPHDQYKYLLHQAIQFASALVDAKDFQDLFEKIEKRNQFKNIDYQYMPWPKPNVSVDASLFNQREKYVSSLFKSTLRQLGNNQLINPIEGAIELDKEKNVVYLNTEEREMFRIFPHGGKLKELTLQKDSKNLIIKNFDTKNFGDANEAILIISQKGEIFALPSNDSRFHHTSILAGGPVFFPGIITISNGQIQKLANNSGHYLPPSLQLIRAMVFLRKVGLLDKDSAGKVWDSNLFALKEVTNNPRVRIMDLGLANLTSSLSRNKNEIEPIFEAVAKNDLPEVQRLVSKDNINKFDAYERTPLMNSIIEGYNEITNFLLPKVDHSVIDQQDCSGMTALLYAISANNEKMVGKLLAAGANPNLSTSDGLNPLALAAWQNNPAIFNLLLSYNADPRNNSEQIISLALLQNARQIVEALAALKLNFNKAIETSINASNQNQILLILINLVSPNALTAEIVEAVKEIIPGLLSEFITFIDDSPPEHKQIIIANTLGSANAFGKMLDDGNRLLLEERLTRNGYKEQVANFNNNPKSIGIRLNQPQLPGNLEAQEHVRQKSLVISSGNSPDQKPRTIK